MRAGHAEHGANAGVAPPSPTLVAPVQIEVGLLSGAVRIQDVQFAADRAHGRVREVGGQLLQCLRVNRLPHVGEEKDFARRLREAAIERGSLPAARNADQPYAAVGKGLDDRLGGVGGSIRHHQDLDEVTGIVQCEQRLEFGADELLSVVYGEDGGYGGAVAGILAHVRRGAPLHHREQQRVTHQDIKCRQGRQGQNNGGDHAVRSRWRSVPRPITVILARRQPRPGFRVRLIDMACDIPIGQGHAA